MTERIRTLRRALGGLALALAAPLASAGFYQWDMVELPASSGAACGNGTPYRFFVNRAPESKSLVMVFEGGGACWDQKACLGEGHLAAANPDGIPPDYMQQFNMASGGLVTPFSSRNGPFQKVQTQSWNIVYVPYCTGDVHSGNKVVVYDDAYPETPRVEYHRGQMNAAAAAAWLRQNLGQPEHLLLTGFSAGGVGSTVTYALVRDALQPTGRASLLADSGPLMQAPRSGTPEQYPSLLLHNKIREAWGLDEPDGLITRYASMQGFDVNNLGTVNKALALRYPQDRFGYLVFELDGTFSAFSYEKFYDDLKNAPDQRAYNQALFARWRPDVERWAQDLGQYANVSYHVPYFRNFNSSHCLTIIDFSGTGIESAGLDDMASFVDNTLDRGPVMRNIEPDNTADYFQPLSWAIRLFKLLSRAIV